MGCYVFCVMCNVDLILLEDVDDLVVVFKDELFLCCFGCVVCLEIEDDCFEVVIDYLFKEFDLIE